MKALYKHKKSGDIFAIETGEGGEVISTAGPHYIVGGYPRPGAIYSQLAMLFIKELQQKAGSATIDSQQLKSFITALFKQ
jgi:hypothetical protein